MVAPQPPCSRSQAPIDWATVRALVACNELETGREISDDAAALLGPAAGQGATSGEGRPGGPQAHARLSLAGSPSKVGAHGLGAQVAGVIGRIVAGFLASGCERSRFERLWALALVVVGLEAGELGGVGWRAFCCGWLRG